ncbi:MAG: hypothetical protein ACI9N3_001384 [Colwellia sp.]|jgi:hypothetical protein
MDWPSSANWLNHPVEFSRCENDKGDRNSNKKGLCCYFKKWLAMYLTKVMLTNSWS